MKAVDTQEESRWLGVEKTLHLKIVDNYRAEKWKYMLKAIRGRILLLYDDFKDMKAASDPLFLITLEPRLELKDSRVVQVVWKESTHSESQSHITDYGVYAHCAMLRTTGIQRAMILGNSHCRGASQLSCVSENTLWPSHFAQRALFSLTLPSQLLALEARKWEGAGKRRSIFAFSGPYGIRHFGPRVGRERLRSFRELILGQARLQTHKQFSYVRNWTTVDCIRPGELRANDRLARKQATNRVSPGLRRENDGTCLDWLREALGTSLVSAYCETFSIGWATGWQVNCTSLIGQLHSDTLMANAAILLACADGVRFSGKTVRFLISLLHSLLVQWLARDETNVMTGRYWRSGLGWARYHLARLIRGEMARARPCASQLAEWSVMNHEGGSSTLHLVRRGDALLLHSVLCGDTLQLDSVVPWSLFAARLYYSADSLCCQAPLFRGVSLLPGYHRNERAGEMGDLRENPLTSGIVRHDSHMRKFGVTRPGIEPGWPWLGGEQSNRDTNVLIWSECFETTLRSGYRAAQGLARLVAHDLAAWVLSYVEFSVNYSSFTGRQFYFQTVSSSDVQINRRRGAVGSSLAVSCSRSGEGEGEGVAVCINICAKLAILAYTRQKAKSKFINRIWLERASQKQPSDIHKTLYDRVKRCREHNYSYLVYNSTCVFCILGRTSIWVFSECSYTAKMNCEYEGLALTSMSMEPRHASSLTRVLHEWLSPTTRVWSSAGMKGWGKWENPGKTRRPTVSSGTIPTCENVATWPGVEAGSPWWEASRLTTKYRKVLTAKKSLANRKRGLLPEPRAAGRRVGSSKSKVPPRRLRFCIGRYCDEDKHQVWTRFYNDGDWRSEV
ncbi:hypothetical protein PR048_030901 [Dryococelus australis]|uniref:Uncharacterized protein n=1 Tax=Dryococelus australis TaxID=614101 RepID=A0ABQ9GE38_9NEOP|nr:hypothetical protein PR048_030901 [Dryococelus australis]